MLSTRQQHCLQGMGIRLWRDREALEAREPSPQPNSDAGQEAQPRPATPLRPAATTPAQETTHREVRHYPLEDWDQLLQGIEACHNCALGDHCTRKVPGKGNREAELMIIGEAPGAQEDRQGLPFVGRAGQLLDRMLKAIDLSTEQVYITNILKCRPPNNRDPSPEEVTACQPFLQAQIRLLKPRVILSVGRISAQNLLQQHTALGQLRQQVHRLPGTDIPLIVTYHPAYLLRNPRDKGKAWDDLVKIIEIYNNPDK